MPIKVLRTPNKVLDTQIKLSHQWIALGYKAQNLQRHIKLKFYDKHLSENRVKSTNCNFALKYASIAGFHKNVSINKLQYKQNLTLTAVFVIVNKFLWNC